MRIAFIGHSYHEKTRSTRFFIELLQSLGAVDVFWDESWSGVESAWARNFDKSHYQLIVVFQAHEALAHVGHHHPNIVFVPMYDAMFWHGDFFWRRSFSKCKVVCFSWRLQFEMMRRGVLQAGFQYFPDPENYAPVVDFDSLRGFFWYRRRDIPVDLVFDLSRRSEFSHFHIHNAPDPENAAGDGWPCPPNIAKLDISTWFESPTQYRDVLRAQNVFFASRAHEGIGMSFLEAMASGQCVVAPSNPTMNEYISDGTNGILYAQDDPAPLDFSRAKDIGYRARESVERGFRRWRDDIPRLLEFLATPRRDLLAEGRQKRISAVPVPKSLEVPVAKASEKRPLVSVVTVCLNAADDIENTLQSVFSQDLEPFEYVVLDGGSIDGTVDILRRFESRLAYWQSEPDKGVYHAMNDAIDKAKGEWILFMNAGDSFVDGSALRRMFARVPETADVVYGHHIYRRGNVDIRKRAADFESTWTHLWDGHLHKDWLDGIPGHQATAIRRDLLRRLRFDTKYGIAADHDLLFRARRDGASFFNCDELLSVYVGGGLSERQYDRCKREWRDIVATYGNPQTAEALYARLNEENAPLSKAAYLRLLAYRAIVAAEQISPSLGMFTRNVIGSPFVLGIGRAIVRLVSFRERAQPEPMTQADPEAAEKPGMVDFRAPEWPVPVSAAEGFGRVDPWGRALVMPKAALSFKQPLPPRFALILEAHLKDGGGPRTISVEAGETCMAVAIVSRADRFYSVPVSNPRGASEMTFALPGSDAVGGGVGFVSLRIEPPSDVGDGAVKSAS